MYWFHGFEAFKRLARMRFNWLIIIVSMRDKERTSKWMIEMKNESENRLMIIKWHLLKALAVNESNTCANALTDNNNNIQWWGVSSVRCLYSTCYAFVFVFTKVFLLWMDAIEILHHIDSFGIWHWFGLIPLCWPLVMISGSIVHCSFISFLMPQRNTFNGGFVFIAIFPVA